VKTGTYKKME